MFNKNFYPTPKDLADKMISRAMGKNRFYFDTVLEPSAGKGDILDALKANHNVRRIFDKDRSKYSHVDCIEIDYQLQAILQQKGYNIVADNFLDFYPSKRYDLIIMNPPFDNGVKHVLKAIDILEKQGSGTFVALLNAESLKNPCYADRKELLQKLEAYVAKIEYIDDAFSHAERRTNVEIALIKCDIKSSYKSSSIFQDALFKAHDTAFEQMEFSQDSMIRGDQVLEFLVEQYNIQVNLLKSACESIHALKAYSGTGLTNEKHFSLYLDNIDYNDTLHRISEAYWQEVIKLGTFRKYMTSEAYHDFSRRLSLHANTEFCMANIIAVKQTLANTFVDNIKKSAINIFDWACQGHMSSFSNNIHYYNGWKTNDAYKINKKIIVRLDYYGRYFSSGFGFSHSCTEINDISLVMSYFDGFKDFKPFGTDIKLDESTGIAENEYIHISAKKKGTTHLTFKRLDLLEKFNYFVAKEKNWLPTNEDKACNKDAQKAHDDILDVIFKDSEAPNEGEILLKLPAGGEA